MPPPLEFQSSPKVARSKSDVAQKSLGGGVQKSKSLTMAAQSQSHSASYSEEKSFKSISHSSSFTQNVSGESKSVDRSQTRLPIAGDGRLQGNTAAEADLFLEELMEEAKKDPSFGVVPGMTNGNAKSEKKERGAIERFNYADTINNNDSRPDSSAAGAAPDNYPFVPRPYRTAQDMIIRDKDSQEKERGREVTRMTQQKHDMVKRPYRTATDFKIEDSAVNRSRSADGRLGKAFRDQDPRLNNFYRTNSTENFTGDMMTEVVTDQKHRSVKDLVAKLETSTKSESENPYVRKWGCDLISPEPRRRNTTFRFQRKQMPDPEFAHKLQYAMSDYGTGSRGGSRARNLSETSHDSHEPFLDTYTTDIEDLVDRQHGEQDIDLVFQDISTNNNMKQQESNNNAIYSTPNKPAESKQQHNGISPPVAVEWPPRSSESQPQIIETKGDNNYQVTQNRSHQQQSYSQQSQMSFKQSVSDYVVNSEEQVSKKKKSKKTQNSNVISMNERNTQNTMSNGSRKYDRNSLIELDNQIMSIQSQFESELDSLIGP